MAEEVEVVFEIEQALYDGVFVKKTARRLKR